jgi:UDP-N-acetylglucosamine 2-epimerase
MKDGQTLYDVVRGTLDGLRGVVEDFRPAVLLVQGDTATVFAASLVGFIERVKVGHVEAGLRSGDKWAPFPEEIFRRLTDVLADYYFSPTPRSRALLLAENVPAARISVTGNTVVDALLDVASREHPVENPELRAVLEDPTSRLVLLTAHRRESFGAPLREIFRAVRLVADKVEDIRIVYPVHLNPSVQGPARELLSDHPRIRLLDPLSYTDLVAALRAASLVLTDSGGIQEEAPTFGAPVLVLRNVTERPEGIEAGVAELVWTNAAIIVDRSLKALATDARHARPNPYGDGKAGARIADIVLSDLAGRPRRTEDWTG